MSEYASGETFGESSGSGVGEQSYDGGNTATPVDTGYQQAGGASTYGDQFFQAPSAPPDSSGSAAEDLERRITAQETLFFHTHLGSGPTIACIGGSRSSETIAGNRVHWRLSVFDPAGAMVHDDGNFFYSDIDPLGDVWFGSDCPPLTDGSGYSVVAYVELDGVVEYTETTQFNVVRGDLSPYDLQNARVSIKFKIGPQFAGDAIVYTGFNDGTVPAGANTVVDTMVLGIVDLHTTPDWEPQTTVLGEVLDVGWEYTGSFPIPSDLTPATYHATVTIDTGRTQSSGYLQFVIGEGVRE